MFEKKKKFSWKIPVLVLVGVLVVGSGVFMGWKVKNSLQASNNQQTASKDVFELN